MPGRIAAQVGGVVDAAALAEFGAKHRATQNSSPQPCVQPGQRHARRQQAVLRKRIGPAERQLEVGA